jgi:hypothetical protein
VVFAEDASTGVRGGHGRIADRFTRYEPRLRAGRSVLGPLSELLRKNCWTIAEWAGEADPHAMQHLLCRASWDSDAVRDDVREYVVDHLRWWRGPQRRGWWNSLNPLTRPSFREWTHTTPGGQCDGFWGGLIRSACQMTISRLATTRVSL